MYPPVDFSVSRQLHHQRNPFTPPALISLWHSGGKWISSVWLMQIPPSFVNRRTVKSVERPNLCKSPRQQERPPRLGLIVVKRSGRYEWIVAKIRFKLLVPKSLRRLLTHCVQGICFGWITQPVSVVFGGFKFACSPRRGLNFWAGTKRMFSHYLDFCYSTPKFRSIRFIF